MRRRFVLGLLACLLLLAVSAAATWIASNPIALDFLTPRIEEATSTGDLDVRVESTRLVWHGRHGPEIRVEGVRILRPDGELLVQLPAVAIDLAFRELLRGRVVLTGLAVEAPAARLVRDAGGHIDIGPREQEGTEEAGNVVLEALIERLSEGPDPEAPLQLQRLRVRKADLEVEDRMLGIRWRAPRVDLEVWRRPEGLAATLRADLDLHGVAGRAESKANWVRGDREVKVSGRVTNLELRPLLQVLLGAETELPSLPVDGSLESRWRIDEGVLPMEGNFELAAADSSDSPAVAALAGLTSRGKIHREGSAARLELKVELDRFDVTHLDAYWPADLAGDARDWVVSNIPAGHVEDGKLELALRVDPSASAPVELEKLEGAFDAHHLLVHYLAPLPEARDVSAHASFDRDRWDFEIGEGRIRDARVDSGKVVIRGLAGDDPRLDVDARFDAPVTTLAAILALPPLELLEGADPHQFQGRAQGSIGLGFPLSGSLRASDLELTAELDVDEAEVREGPLHLREGDLHIDATLQQLTVSGEARLHSRPIRLVARQWVGDEPGVRRYEIRGDLLTRQPPLPTPTFEVDATRDDAGWRGVTARVDVGGDHSQAEYSAAAATRSLAIESADLGSLLSALDVSAPLHGGTLEVQASAPGPQAPFDGHFELVDFNLGETPLLSRLLGALALARIETTLKDEGLRWDHLDGDFGVDDGVLEVRGARAVGPLLALTVDGSLVLESQEIRAKGAIAPLESLNDLLGHVPVLGRVLGSHDPLVTAGYRAGGTLQDPEVSVDPWTTLVPGPVRDLVGSGRRLGRHEREKRPN